MYLGPNFISILFQTSSVSLSKLHFHTFPNLICIFVLISLPYFSKPHLYLQRWKGRRDQVGLQLCQPKFLLCGPPTMSAKDWRWLFWLLHFVNDHAHLFIFVPPILPTTILSNFGTISKVVDNFVDNLKAICRWESTKWILHLPSFQQPHGQPECISVSTC